jgi:hypothetical protein
MVFLIKLHRYFCVEPNSSSQILFNAFASLPYNLNHAHVPIPEIDVYPYKVMIILFTQYRIMTILLLICKVPQTTSTTMMAILLFFSFLYTYIIAGLLQYFFK